MLENTLSPQKPPPGLDTPKLSILPFLIKELEKEISYTISICLAEKRVKEYL
jgi:hypothetical protein